MAQHLKSVQLKKNTQPTNQKNAAKLSHSNKTWREHQPGTGISCTS